MLFTSPRTLAPLAALSVLVGFTSIITEVRAVDYSTDAVVVPLDLSSYLNNKGTSDAPGQADLNGEGWSIPYAGFPTGNLTYRGIQVRSYHPRIYPTNTQQALRGRLILILDDNDDI